MKISRERQKLEQKLCREPTVKELALSLGVSPEALAEVDGLVGLPMLGEKASINVGNAAAAILYAVAATAQYGVKL